MGSQRFGWCQRATGDRDTAFSARSDGFQLQCRCHHKLRSGIKCGQSIRYLKDRANSYSQVRAELAPKQRYRRESAGRRQRDLHCPQTSREKSGRDLTERGVRARAHNRYKADLLQFIGGQFIGETCHAIVLTFRR
jgi:hypothetical protein